MKRLFYSSRYYDREELEDRLEELRDIEDMLSRAVRDAAEHNIVVEVQDYALHMQIVELEEQLAELQAAEERAMNRAYERSVLCAL